MRTSEWLGGDLVVCIHIYLYMSDYMQIWWCNLRMRCTALAADNWKLAASPRNPTNFAAALAAMAVALVKEKL